MAVDGTNFTPETFDIQAARDELRPLTPVERIQWSGERFGPGLMALTSAGVESALLWDQAHESGVDVPFVHVNTGFLHPETVQFRDELQSKYGFRIHEVGPTTDEVADVQNRRLWESNFPAYSEITKLRPLTRAIGELGIVALLTGIRAGQTQNRRTKTVIDWGNNGELRVNALVDMTETEATRLFRDRNLPRHPLYALGYGSIADVHTTQPGNGREGRQEDECGLHVVDGKLVRARQAG